MQGAPEPPSLAPFATDLALVHRVRLGVADAGDLFAGRMQCVARILRTHGRRFGLRLAGEELDDLTQQVLLRVLTKLPTYAGRASLESWVFSFCDGELRNLARRRRRTRRCPPLRTSDDGDPAAHEQRAAEVQKALLRLRTGDRRLVLQKHFEGHTLEHIARATGVNLNTVKSRYTRALARLRHLLDGQAPATGIDAARHGSTGDDQAAS